MKGNIFTHSISALLVSVSIAVAQEQPSYDNPVLSGDTITVAAVNVPSVKYDFEAGLALAKKIVEEAKADGATYIAFPETWLPGFINSDEGTIAGGPPQDLDKYIENCIEPGSDRWNRLASVAKDAGVYLSMGYCEVDPVRKLLYMSNLVVSPEGEVLINHRKIRPSGGERVYFSDAPIAENLKVVNTPIGRLSMLSCAENYKPMMGYSIAAQYPNIHVAAWPYSVGKDEGIWWERFNILAQPHSAALAHRMGSWVIAPSVFQSSIYNPMGEMVAHVNNKDGNYALAKIDTSAFREKPLQLADYDADSLKLMLLSYPGNPGIGADFKEVLEQPRYATGK